MPDFEQLNFKVEAQDNATKVLENILKVLNELEKKMNSLSNIKHPVFSMSKEQVRLIANWDKLDKKLQKVEKDLKEVGKAQKKLEKFEIVPKGKPLFTYDAGTESYIDNNVGVARRESERIKELLEKQGIQDLVKSWGKSKLALPIPKLVMPDLENYEPEFVGATKPDWADSFIEDENYISSEIEKYIKNRKTNLKKNNLNEILNGLNLNDGYNKLLLEVLNKKTPTDSDKEIAKLITDLNNYKNEIKKSKNLFLKTENEDELKRITDNLKIIIEQYKNTKNKIAELQESLKNQTTGLGKWSELGKDYLKPIRTIEKLNKDGSVDKTSFYSEKIGDTVYNYEVVNDEIKKITTQTKKAQKEAAKLQNAFKNVKKFVKSIGRIVLYRAIRSAMAEIKKAVTTSFEDLAKYDDAYNETLSKLVTSLDVLQASMGLIIQPFVEALEPTIGNIVDLFAEVANYISYINAQTKKESTYLKINSEYAKDFLDSLKQANNLLSFDKFEVLQKSEEKDIYETASVADGIDTSQTIQDIGDFIINGSTTLESVLTTLEIVAELLEPLRLLQPLTKLSDTVDGIANVLEGIFTLDYNLVNGGIEQLIEKLIVIPTIELIESFVNSLLNGLNFIGKILNKLFEWLGIDYRSAEDIKLWDAMGEYNKRKDEYSNMKARLPESYSSDEILGTASSNARSRVNNSTILRSSLDSELNNTARIEIDFKNVNNNAISRELAKTMAEQFRKQNISVNI